MKEDWNRRATIDADFFVAGTHEATAESYALGAAQDVEQALVGVTALADAHILDVGCGVGRLSCRLAARSAYVLGVDVSPAMIDEGRRRHGHLANLDLRVGTGVDLEGVPPDRFDLAICYSVLPHVPRSVVARYFPELGRVLKPGGTLRYQIWVGDPVALPDSDTLGNRVLSSDEVDHLHTSAGLSAPEYTPIAHHDPLLGIRPTWVTARRTGSPGEPITLAIPDTTDGVSPKDREYALLVHLGLRHLQHARPMEAAVAIQAAHQLAPGRPEAQLLAARLAELSTE